ncbi:non-canonical purine NTP pyrophosphatase [Gleimia hominis]|uniref:dITP/XTP pyrophosphatase n=1 Tax=Gleimia hominis TaxID=595468 RepID=A0ABU3IBQ7_9ACTO|nr:non-canonical purine NTP pyrophosphatase [Gleimia hominis]MDT3767814.1 non-canonical purine NTP pyrophosphatase [Gleimia hominis]
MARLILATHNAHKADELHAILEPLIPDLAREDIVTSADFGYPEPVEDGLTFEQNALIKARAAANASGLAAVADDSGLCVDVLGGAPGIFSARWSGTHGDDRANLELLLAQLADIAPAHRGAQFHCAAALVVPRRTEPQDIMEPEGSNAPQEPRKLEATAPQEPKKLEANAAGSVTEPGSQNGPQNPLETQPSGALEVVEHGIMRGHLIERPRGEGGFGYDPIFVPQGLEQTSAQISAARKNELSHRGKAFRALAEAIRKQLA